MATDKSAEETGAAKSKAELPHVESPSISPAETNKPEREELKPLTESAPSIFVVPAAKPGFRLRPRHKRAALIAASLTLAAALGSAVGAMTTQHLAAPAKPPVDVAANEDRKVMQQSLAHLSQQVATLKMNLDVATRTAHNEMEKAHSEMARLSDRLATAAADITGSIAAPQSVPAVAATAEPTPLPQPRPAQLAAVEPMAMRLPVVSDWTLRAARDGMALVEGHGEVYQAVLGAPLPGLGPVQTIKREDGRWIVVTPRGIIVSSRDRHYFD